MDTTVPPAVVRDPLVITVTLTATIPATLVDEIIDGVMGNYPEANDSNCLQCVHWKYKLCKFKFIDTEDDEKVYLLDRDKLAAVIPLLWTPKWPRGCTKPPAPDADAQAWNDWACQCDNTDHDAFVQLACFGETIYS